jgi:hypothetical protein
VVSSRAPSAVPPDHTQLAPERPVPVVEGEAHQLENLRPFHVGGTQVGAASLHAQAGGEVTRHEQAKPIGPAHDGCPPGRELQRLGLESAAQ